MNADTLFSLVNSFRREKRGYRSNAFFTLPQLQGLLDMPGTRVVSKDGLVVLLQKEDALTRVSYFARSADDLEQIGTLLPKSEGPVMVDVVGKDPAANAEANLLCGCGFELYSTFVRMIAPEPLIPGGHGVERVEHATAVDIDRLYELICDAFDPLFAHFPSWEELQQYTDAGEILVIREDGEIAGMAFFEHTSDRYITLRYFVVDPRFRGRNIGGSLLAYEFWRKPAQAVYMLWIGTYNDTQALYKKLGFRYDGLKDYILRYKGETYGQNAVER